MAFDFKCEEQREAVMETLRTIERVYTIRGCVGARKTTCLREVRKRLEASGRTAWYLEPNLVGFPFPDDPTPSQAEATTPPSAP